jgi:drug/metabolite transporter (DMT)-like permease
MRQIGMAAAVAGGLASALIWGGQAGVTRHGVTGAFTPFDVNALRFAVAGVLLLPVLLRAGIADLGGIGWRRGIVLALAAGAPYASCYVGGLAFAPAAHGALITPGLVPVLTALIGRVVLRSALARAHYAGLGLVVTGVVLIGVEGLRSGEGDVWIGDLCFVAAAALWATYTVAARGWGVDPLIGAAVISVLNLLYLPVYALFAGPALLQAPAGEILLQAVYQGLFVSVAALFFYARAVAALGSAKGALFPAVVPALGVLIAIPVVGEIPTAVQLLGLIATTAGMLLALGWGRAR